MGNQLYLQYFWERYPKVKKSGAIIFTNDYS